MSGGQLDLLGIAAADREPSSDAATPKKVEFLASMFATWVAGSSPSKAQVNRCRPLAEHVVREINNQRGASA